MIGAQGGWVMAHRVAFVTSGAKGLGHAMVRSLLEAGFDVCFTYGKSKKEANELVHEAHVIGRQATALCVNLLKRSEVERAVSNCISEFSRIDVLVHNFGPFVFDRVALSEYTDGMWAEMFDGNLNNFFWLFQAVIDGMRDRGFGRIVTVGFDGAGAADGWRLRAAYAAAKAGLASLTRSIAKEERQNGITANMVCPGDIQGERKMQRIRDIIHNEGNAQRAAVGEDVARVVAMLCEDQSQLINGTVTEVTGGYELHTHDD
jgi:3-oxoacyl-[acyl-carrier protein] reductase